LLLTAHLQVAADAISRWLYPQLDPQLRLIDLSSEQQQQHKDFLAGWIELLSTAPSMMPFDKVSSWQHVQPCTAAIPMFSCSLLSVLFEVYFSRLWLGYVAASLLHNMLAAAMHRSDSGQAVVTLLR
jgi:hypothetical protein